ncbi:formin-like protein 11 [Olea europaea var. sylvestris]|uniref:formin-like protein 11 n=1 Tax=Olea europaea var. sylvestris TaxID=158386 RepID=UPI000C1D4F15|nr:formin-like protein 11 [Olea europaea var. sylvestris]
MGHGFQILHMIFIFIFILTSYHCTHNFLVVKASFNAGGYRDEDRKTLILEKLRVLLGLKSFHIKRPPNAYSPTPEPAPGPCGELNIGTDAPAPTPVLHPHGHPRPPSHHYHRPMPSTRKIQNGDKGTSMRVWTAILVSVGVTSLVLCAIGIYWGCRNFERQKKRSKKTISVFSTEAGITSKSKYMSAQSSVKKVNSNPGPDPFYLDSLETALEPETFCLKLNLDTQDTYSNQVPVKQECENDRDSTVGEITTAREISEYKYEFDSCNSSSRGEKVITEEVDSVYDKFIPEEANSSDDESFHSFCDSHAKLSNASAGSLSDNLENFSQNESKVSHFSVVTTTEKPIQISQLPLAPSQSSPPPPVEHIYPSKSIPFSTKRIPNLLSSSSSESKKNPHIELSLPPPPPPCPPPFPKGNVNSLKVPPPPPSQLTQRAPLGKDGAPLPKLKPLHWDKVRAAPDRSTVWDKMRSSSFEFDEDMIESLFGYNLQNTMKNDEVKSKTPSPSKHVLEPKRLQNITILSKALNVSTEQVCAALIQGDGLSLQDLEALTKMVPTDEEEAKLANYKGDSNELGSAEKLVKQMLKVPFAFLRIEAMLYRENFEDEVFHLRKSFSMLEEACKELRSSRLFLKLLEAVLKTGNRMNVGTIRGGATAFKLDTLLKLADVKGTDGKTTLLHFVVQEIIRSEGFRVSESIMGKINQRSKTSKIEDKEENYRRMGLDLVSGLSTELYNVKKMATIDLDVLASSVANLSDGMSKLQHLVNKIIKMEDENGNFVKSMRSFLNYGETKLKELQEDENGVLLHVRQMTEYFHGDVSKDESNPLRIFVIVRDFLNMLDNVCKELRSSKATRSPNPLASFR